MVQDFTILPGLVEVCVNLLILLIGGALCTNKAAAVFSTYERHKCWNVCLAAVDLETCMLHKWVSCDSALFQQPPSLCLA